MTDLIQGSAAHQRHELKFVFRNTLAIKLIGWLEACCPPDPKFPGGTVNSVYFDTSDGLFFADKANSFFLKTKVRIRWYADLSNQNPGEAAFFEIKNKMGGRRDKTRVPIDWSGSKLAALDLRDPIWLTLPQLKGMDGWSPPAPLYPSAKIAYRRRRYLEPTTHSRLAIDYDIQVADACHPSGILEEGVVEVKGSLVDLPPFLYPLTEFGCRRQSFSKYGSALTYRSAPH